MEYTTLRATNVPINDPISFAQMGVDKQLINLCSSIYKNTFWQQNFITDVESIERRSDIFVATSNNNVDFYCQVLMKVNCKKYFKNLMVIMNVDKIKQANGIGYDENNQHIKITVFSQLDQKVKELQAGMLMPVKIVQTFPQQSSFSIAATLGHCPTEFTTYKITSGKLNSKIIEDLNVYIDYYKNINDSGKKKEVEDLFYSFKTNKKNDLTEINLLEVLEKGDSFDFKGSWGRPLTIHHSSNIICKTEESDTDIVINLEQFLQIMLLDMITYKQIVRDMSAITIPARTKMLLQSYQQ